MKSSINCAYTVKMWFSSIVSTDYILEWISILEPVVLTWIYEHRHPHDKRIQCIILGLFLEYKSCITLGWYRIDTIKSLVECWPILEFMEKYESIIACIGDKK